MKEMGNFQNLLKKACALFLLWPAMPLASSAQTVVWQLPPSDYDQIVRMGADLYKVTRHGKIGLIHADGTVVAPAENDALTPFHDHKALLTRVDEQGERVVGCLTDDGRFHAFDEAYYTLTGQDFYSDDVLSVADAKGRAGYVDAYGKPVVGFDGKYDRIKPFTEGYAAVFKDKKYHLIDKKGTPVRFRFEGVGEVYGGTNVYQGLAYIWDTDGDFYTYDTKHGGPCRRAKVPKENRTFDYLYRMSCISGSTKEVPFTSEPRRGTKGIGCTVKDGLAGYLIGETAVLPCQLTAATAFEDGYAVVELNGKQGILKFIESGTFGLTVPRRRVDFYAGEAATCTFNLTTPGAWRDKALTVSLEDEAGTTYVLRRQADSYTFSAKPTATAEEGFRVTVMAEGLKLFEAPFTLSFVKKVRCATCGRDTEACPYGGRHPKTSPKKPQQPQEQRCPTCGLPISQCKYQGVH